MMTIEQLKQNPHLAGTAEAFGSLVDLVDALTKRVAELEDAANTSHAMPITDPNHPARNKPLSAR